MTLIIGLLIFLVGLAMAGGGIWLAALGGSWYYAIAGIVMMLSGVLLVARHRVGAWLYWLVLAGTAADRKSVVSGKRVSVRVDLGGRRLIKKQKKPNKMKLNTHVI